MEGASTDRRQRLERHSPVELEITMRHLRHLVQDGATVAHIGVGAGLYAAYLARRGCQLVLVDVAPELLDESVVRLRALGLAARIRAVHRASGADLHAITSREVDAVLMFGPLYHLREPAERTAAAAEAARILKPNGILLATGLNRMLYLRELYRQHPQVGAALRGSCLRFLEDGNVSPAAPPSMGASHFCTAEEIRALFADAFEPLVLSGMEAFTAGAQLGLTEMEEADRESWLDVVEQAGATIEGLGCAERILYVGRRRP